MALAGCAQWESGPLGVLAPYRIDVVQGNVVTQDLIERIRPGLRRIQVRELLGTPLVTDAFHADRWDYVFTLNRQGSTPQRQALVLHFEGDVLKKVDAPPKLASEKEFVASISRRPDGKMPEPRLTLTDEERKALPAPPRPAVDADEPVGPIRPYPPLEPQ
jgi:outer membrane protein assembly factor BamE